MTRKPSLPSMLVASVAIGLLALLTGCSCGAQVGAATHAVPADGAVDAGVATQFQAGGQVGPRAKRCGPDGCPAPAAK